METRSQKSPKEKYTTPASLVIMLYTKWLKTCREQSPFSAEPFFVVFCQLVGWPELPSVLALYLELRVGVGIARSAETCIALGKQAYTVSVMLVTLSAGRMGCLSHLVV